MKIKEVLAKKIKDSRNGETIEVEINGCKASAPEGKSTGKYENFPYKKNIDWNIESINKLNELKSIEINKFDELEKIENLIKERFKLKEAKQFGANALFALESAILKALAKSKKKELWEIVNPKLKEWKMPVPLGNAVGGGLHSSNIGKPVFQEFLIIPNGESFEKNVETMNEVYNKIGMMINGKDKNDEGAWETSLTDEDILGLLDGFKEKVKIGIDVAASTFYDKNEKKYKYRKIKLTRGHQIAYINNLIEKHNLFYVEDPLEEEDFQGFKEINKNNLIVGDDLTTTNIERAEKAIKMRSINGMIIKPNQNGSLLEVKKIFDICRKKNIKTILSHRSGETMDNAISDYAFAFQADFVKFGIATKWREVKLKRLIEIEKSLKR